MAEGNLVVVQGGGPSPVLNATLAAIVEEARRGGRIGRVLGSRSGIQGLIAGQVSDLSAQAPEWLNLLRKSPGAALGSSRSRPSGEDMERLLATLRRLEIRYLIFTGGNGTMRGAQVTADFLAARGYEAGVIGAPKTVDNDLAGTDRCPGYASAARYVAQSTRDLGMDVRGLPQPISIFETMGRSAGWLAAAAVAARMEADDAPQMVYVPERPFEQDVFLSRLDGVVRRQGWAVVVVSEGIRDAGGRLVYETQDPAQADALKRPLTGGVGQHLAEMVAKNLRMRCRSEKPGLLGRASMLHASAQDLRDAETVGRSAVRTLVQGESGKMVALRRLPDPGCSLIDLAEVAGVERPLPEEWLCDGPLPVGDGFLNYLRPLIGELESYHAPLSFGWE